ncbi:MAG: DUF2256 domain-containing protein [Planctomycetota bacterium]
MPRGNHNPQNLPTKTCPVCGRDFAWRKKWERDWEQVKFCSKACGKRARSAEKAESREA